MMDPISVQSHLRSLTHVGKLNPRLEIPGMASGSGIPGVTSGESFKDILVDSIGKVNALQSEADMAIEKLVSGETGNIHGTLLAVQRAELSMRMLVEVRNKVISAYHEIMRLQV